MTDVQEAIDRMRAEVARLHGELRPIVMEAERHVRSVPQ